jgi:hypothetical protein
MKLLLNKNSFVNTLLSPVSKLTDNLLLECQSSDHKAGWSAKTLVNSPDNSVILLAEIPCTLSSEEKFRCVIPDCKTFMRLFAGIDDSQVELEIDSNVIKYKNASLSFKYHLLDESYIVNKKSVNEEKLKKLTFDTNFSLTKQKLSEIIKFNSIVPEAEKLYFITENNKVLAKLGDELKTNTNEIVTEISGSFEGNALLDKFPINIQNVLLFSFNDEKIDVSINQTLKVFKFKTPQITYIVSGLVR